MKAVIAIPARYASSRFPAKPLAKILGKPMIEWVVKRCEMAQIGQVVVATDHQEIAQTVHAFGGTAIMTDEDHPNGTSRIHEAIQNMDAELVLNVQGDEPTIDPSVIQQLYQLMLAEPSPDMGTLAEPCKPEQIENPNCVKVVLDQNQHAITFSRSPIPYPRNPSPSFTYLKHIGLYAYRRDFLAKMVAAEPCDIEKIESLEQLRALYLGAKIKVGLTQKSSVGVDTPQDIALAEARLRAMEGE